MASVCKFTVNFRHPVMAVRYDLKGLTLDASWRCPTSLVPGNAVRIETFLGQRSRLARCCRILRKNDLATIIDLGATRDSRANDDLSELRKETHHDFAANFPALASFRLTEN